MPLSKGKSNRAFVHNVKAEMNAGKPQKQALAIAYATKRKAKKMSMGGKVADEDTSEDVHADDSFLSAEDGNETPFQTTGNVSDEEELEESGFLPEHDEAAEGPEEMHTRLQSIMDKVKRKNLRG